MPILLQLFLHLYFNMQDHCYLIMELFLFQLKSLLNYLRFSLEKYNSNIQVSYDLLFNINSLLYKIYNIKFFKFFLQDIFLLIIYYVVDLLVYLFYHLREIEQLSSHLYQLDLIYVTIIQVVHVYYMHKTYQLFGHVYHKLQVYATILLELLNFYLQNALLLSIHDYF